MLARVDAAPVVRLEIHLHIVLLFEQAVEPEGAGPTTGLLDQRVAAAVTAQLDMQRVKYTVYLGVIIMMFSTRKYNPGYRSPLWFVYS